MVKEIKLTQGKVALVSDVDFDFLNQFSWSFDGDYACSGTKKQYMHKLVAARLGLNGLIDHRNRNKLDNTRDNLREATSSQNRINSDKLYGHNTSGVKGVYLRFGKWTAYINKNGRRFVLGTFNTIEQAASARKAAEKRMFGEFAP
jgi:hypothetical protein